MKFLWILLKRKMDATCVLDSGDGRPNQYRDVFTTTSNMTNFQSIPNIPLLSMIRVSFLYSFFGNMIPTLMNCGIANIDIFKHLPPIESPMLCGISAGMVGSWTIYSNVIGFYSGQRPYKEPNRFNDNLPMSFLVITTMIFTGFGIFCSWIAFQPIGMLICGD